MKLQYSVSHPILSYKLEHIENHKPFCYSKSLRRPLVPPVNDINSWLSPGDVEKAKEVGTRQIMRFVLDLTIIAKDLMDFSICSNLNLFSLIQFEINTKDKGQRKGTL